MLFIKFLIFLMAIQVLRAQDMEPMADSSMEVMSEPSSEPMLSDESGEHLVYYSTESSAAADSSTAEDETQTLTLIMEEMEPTAEPSSESSTEANELVTEADDYSKDYSFSCYGRSFGQYADVSKDCRVFHLCYPFFNPTNDELLYQRISFQCDNDSVFDQKRFICVDNATVGHKCSDSEDLYKTSNQEYLIRVFSQNLQPGHEVKEASEPTAKVTSGTGRNGWFSWLYD